MKELKKLVQIVADRGKKNLPILDIKAESSENNKELELFRIIEGLEPATDKAASLAMYDTGVEDPRYKMLKHRLKNRLLNHLFFIDFKDHRVNVSFQFEQECLNLVHFTRMLIKQGDKDISEKLALKALSLAKETEFTYIIVSCLELLRSIYTVTYQWNNYKEVVEELDHYRKINEIEIDAENLFTSLRICTNKSVNSRKKALPDLKKALTTLDDLYKKTNSFLIFDRHYRLNLAYLEMIGNFDEIIKITQKIEKLYEESKLNIMRFDLRINKHAMVWAYLRSKRYEEGLQLAEEYSSHFDKTTGNYFNFMENYFLMAMHAGKYNFAYDILKKCTRSPYFFRIRQGDKERWNLYKAYMYFIKPDKRLQKTFDFNKFYQTIPRYSKDKKGFNIAIMVLQFLHYLQNWNEESIEPLIERFRKYSALHLYHPTSQRSRIFLKLLIIASENSLNPEIFKAKGAVSYQKLKTLTPPGDAYAEIEIIPYEKLWDLVLEMMERKPVEVF